MYIKNARIYSIQTQFPHAKITNYGQILYKTIPEPFKHIHHQDYQVSNQAECLHLDVYHTGSFTL